MRRRRLQHRSPQQSMIVCALVRLRPPARASAHLSLKEARKKREEKEQQDGQHLKQLPPRILRLLRLPRALLEPAAEPLQARTRSIMKCGR